jgi:hypothetical protein
MCAPSDRAASTYVDGLSLVPSPTAGQANYNNLGRELFRRSRSTAPLIDVYLWILDRLGGATIMRSL